MKNSITIVRSLYFVVRDEISNPKPRAKIPVWKTSNGIKNSFKLKLSKFLKYKIKNINIVSWIENCTNENKT